MKYSKQHAAVCGLYCPACSVFIGTQEDPQRLESIAKQSNSTPEEIKCFGCRSEKRFIFCEQDCKMFPCAQEKGIDFCGECEEYPCNDLKEFQAKMPHRLELWEAQEQIKKLGYEKWLEKMEKHYSCSECGTINSTYDPRCRSCGHQPCNQYNAIHGKEILEFFSKPNKE